MGFNATVVVLLDRLSEIENDPEFGKKLAAAIRYRGSHPNPDGKYDSREPYVPGQTSVIGVEHSSALIAYVVGGNCGRQLGYGGGYAATNEAVIKNLDAERRRGMRDAKRRGEQKEASGTFDNTNQPIEATEGG